MISSSSRLVTCVCRLSKRSDRRLKFRSRVNSPLQNEQIEVGCDVAQLIKNIYCTLGSQFLQKFPNKPETRCLLQKFELS